MKNLTLLTVTIACHLAWAQAPNTTMDAPPPAANAPTAQSASAAPMTEEQVAKVLVTINEGEIDAAKMAVKKAQTEDVKNFAKMMIEEHKTNEADTKKVASKNKMSMANSDLAKMLKEDAKKSNMDLKKSSKAEFDKAYIAEQVAMHEKALRTIDETLIPNAKTPELTQHLQKTRVAVSEHLNHAKGLQSSMAR